MHAPVHAQRQPGNPIDTISKRGKMMKRRLTAKALLASLAIAPLASAPAASVHAQSVARPAADLVLSIGRGELVTLPATMSDVFVANDAVADVQVKSQRQLYVFGKAGGETTIYASNAAGDVIWSANVRVGSNLDSIDQMLALAMPDARIGVATMGTNTILLTGTVAAPEDVAEAERLVQAFVGDDHNVISRLKMATPLQVNLQVKFAEVSRTLIRAIGANLTTLDSSGGFKFGIGRGRDNFGSTFRPGSALGVGNEVTVTIPDPNNPGRFIDVPGSSITQKSGDTTFGFAKRLLGLDLLGALDLGERNGLVTTLSQPNLTALSGETADFLAGGEFPIPVSQGLGATSIEYRKFGVSLSYTPTVLSNGRISLRVRPEVSELSDEGSVTLNGFSIPSLTVRRAETTIELGSGQSFMIAGLMSNSSQNTIDKTPGAGDIPIIGNLFRSRAFRKGETELVIVVTPYLVNPVDAKDIKLPTDGFRTANAAQSMLGFQDNAGKSGEQRPGPTVNDKQAPSPSVSQYDPAASVPSQIGSQDKKAKRAATKRRKKDREAAAPKPGFSL